MIFLFYVFIGNFDFQRPKKVIFPLTFISFCSLFCGLPKDKAVGVGKIKKFILTTAVYEMLTEKDHYNAITIIHIQHNYSSSADSE